MRWFISVRPRSSRRARWPDSFARRKHFHERAAGTAIRRAEKKSKPAGSVEIIDGFPPSVRGRVLFIDKDNLNTDGIYGSKHTYRDDMTPEEMAAVTFENYDPNFNTLYQKGDVVVGGLNFGSGSSREQAATALKFKGIPCVIAASFSETYKRNAFNNGFVVFECPELVTHLRDTLKDRAPTTVGPEITIDYAKSISNVDGKSFAFPPLSPAAQELIVAGGAENLVAVALREKAENCVKTARIRDTGCFAGTAVAICGDRIRLAARSRPIRSTSYG